MKTVFVFYTKISTQMLTAFADEIIAGEELKCSSCAGGNVFLRFWVHTEKWVRWQVDYNDFYFTVYTSISPTVIPQDENTVSLRSWVYDLWVCVCVLIIIIILPIS